MNSKILQCDWLILSLIMVNFNYVFGFYIQPGPVIHAYSCKIIKTTKLKESYNILSDISFFEMALHWNNHIAACFMVIIFTLKYPSLPVFLTRLRIPPSRQAIFSTFTKARL